MKRYVMMIRMKYVFGFLALLLVVPGIAQAATLQQYLISIIAFIGDTIVPFLFAFAIFFLIWNILRYFILSHGDEKGVEKGKNAVLWGVIALVVLIAFWGIINLLVDAVGLGNAGYICPDYLDPSDCTNNGSMSGTSRSTGTRATTNDFWRTMFGR